ncbi:hypothetical protein BJ165DRAFT_1524479 [Panaeolus papilionaceus]|nr:hypothetical protein BJ165DRAFT_1524479 [Panaeolus papilionaceus]
MTESAPTTTSQIKAGDEEVILKTPKIGASVDLGGSSVATTNLAEDNDRSTPNAAEDEDEDPNADLGALSYNLHEIDFELIQLGTNELPVPNSDLEDEDAGDKEDEASTDSIKVIDADPSIDDEGILEFKKYQFRAPAASATSTRLNASRQAEMQRIARQKEEEMRRREEEERRRAARGSDASSTNSSVKSRR